MNENKATVILLLGLAAICIIGTLGNNAISAWAAKQEPACTCVKEPSK